MGICADESKGELEEESEGRARRLAMRNASELLKIQLYEIVLKYNLTSKQSMYVYKEKKLNIFLLYV